MRRPRPRVLLLAIMLALVFVPGPQPAAARRQVAAPPALRTIYHVVSVGETVQTVAARYGLSTSCILEANPGLVILRGRRLPPGLGLRVPLWAAATIWPAPGLSLPVISEIFGVSLEDLCRTNGLLPDATLQRGRPLYLPVAGIPGNGVSHEEAVVTTTAGGWQCIARMPWPVWGLVSRVYGGPATHKGLDIAADLGAVVLCPRDGVVIDAGCGTAWDPSGTYGLYVRVAHSNGIETLYAHLSRQSVVIGQEVRVGDVLGEVGSTGRSSGPHLHFEVRVQGEAVDPRPVLRGAGS